jgi:4-amino-4-deoxy-L-arabinose transferase-like glycosyltransferase
VWHTGCSIPAVPAGSDGRRERTLRLAPLLPIALASVLFAWGAGTLPFYTRGEPREGLVVWDMVHARNWILPLRNGTEIPSKPPLFHWLGALAASAAGRVDELTVRLPSIMLAVLGIALTYVAGARAWNARAGCMAALILATSFEWVRAATTARVDMTLTCCVLAALVLVWRIDCSPEGTHGLSTVTGWLLALGTLAKGPVGVVLPSLVVATHALSRRDRTLLRKLDVCTILTIVLLVAGTWYALATWEGGTAFLTKQVVQENILRFVATDRGGRGHEHPPLYLVPSLVGGLAPWSLFLPAVAVFLVRARRRLDAENLRYPLIWFGVVFLFFTAASGKRSVYLLPAYPAAALLLAAWWSKLDDPGEHGLAYSRAARIAVSACAVAFAAIAALLAALAAGADPVGAVHGFLAPADAANVEFARGVAHHHRRWLLLAAALEAVAAAVVVRGARQRAWTLAFRGIVMGTAAAVLVVQAAYHPALAAAHTYKPFMARVRAAVGNDRPLYFYGTKDYGAIFYARRHVPVVPWSALPATDTPIYLLVHRLDWKALAPDTRAEFRILDRSRETGPKRDRRLLLVRGERSAVECLPPIRELRKPRSRVAEGTKGGAAEGSETR